MTDFTPRFRLLPCLIAGLFPFSSQAAEPRLTTDQVVVTATRMERNSFDLPVSIDVVVAEQMQFAQPMVNTSESLARVPGIYAAERLPIERLQRGTPALVDADDVHTNHIHADDLAHIAFVALWRGRSQRTLHAVDDTDMKMGEYFDAVARAYGLTPPPRLARDALRAAVSPMLYSFMSESRRLDNRRLHRELRARLRWPTVDAFLRSHRRAAGPNGILPR